MQFIGSSVLAKQQLVSFNGEIQECEAEPKYLYNLASKVTLIIFSSSHWLYILALGSGGGDYIMMGTLGALSHFVSLFINVR